MPAPTVPRPIGHKLRSVLAILISLSILLPPRAFPGFFAFQHFNPVAPRHALAFTEHIPYQPEGKALSLFVESETLGKISAGLNLDKLLVWLQQCVDQSFARIPGAYNGCSNAVDTGVKIVR